MNIITLDFSRFLSIKIGPILDVFEIQDQSDLALLPKGTRILGHGNNMLVSPNALYLAKLGCNFSSILDLNSCIEIGANTSSRAIFNYFKMHNLGGLEFLGALPGSLGGLIKMNAGMKEYEIKNALLEVLIYSNNCAKWHDIKELKMSYRNSQIDGVILSARFKKMQGFDFKLYEHFCALRQIQPKAPSFGSCFKNPKGNFAAKLIEDVGLKGIEKNGVCFSKQHANFMTKIHENASFQSALDLLNLAKEKVFNKFGIALENEVIIIQ
ncbi:MAG: UDP-N-acetylmuramate dehydrogenase [Helicobacter sp.]|nr:UDP-N-acetylmuramate dehydrogenase [Helicobacter sp.]